jgi:hypothetical protein
MESYKINTGICKKIANPKINRHDCLLYRGIGMDDEKQTNKKSYDHEKT